MSLEMCSSKLHFKVNSKNVIPSRTSRIPFNFVKLVPLISFEIKDTNIPISLLIPFIQNHSQQTNES